MLQLVLELLPFVVFVAIGIFAFAEPASCDAGTTKVPRPRTFCRFSENGTLMLADPDGKPVKRRQRT